jgi:putative pbsx phage terminase small subunit
MKNENIKLLIKNEYENGAGVTELSKKYKVSANTINSWKKREKWQKKVAPKGNAPNSKKCTKNKTGANEIEIQIQRDILEGKSKQEIMSEYGISERTYSRKTKNARYLRKERTEKYLEQIADEVYKGELYRILKGTETAKANLVVRTTKEINSQEMDTKKVQEYEKAYTTIKKMGNDLMRTGKMLTAYEVLEIDRQLAEEEM